MHCNKCKESATDFVLCTNCDGRYHYVCAGISESSYRKMGQDKKSAWRCVSCRTLPADPSGAAVLAELLREVKSLRVDFNAMKSDFNNVQSDIRATKECVQELDFKWRELETKFSGIENRTSSVEKNISNLTATQTKLEETISELKYENNLQDQFSRQNNVEISGIPQKKGENLFSILHDLCVVVGFNLTDADIDTVHRVRPFRDRAESGAGPGSQGHPPRHPAVIVRFTRRGRKDQLIAAVRARRGITTSDIGIPGPASNVYVGDHLTPNNKLLLRQARQLKLDKNYSYLWVKDCKILMRKHENSNIIRIAKESDLNKVK